MRKIISLLSTVTVMATCLFAGVSAAKNNALCEKFVRVHILANSNSHYDQAMKMAVRDYVFNTYEKEFSKFETKKDSLKYLEENKEKLTDSINDYLLSNGVSYTADTKIVTEDFKRKSYGNITLPGGIYDAVKITLGKGEGRNFFCVMFPPMCIDEGLSVKVKLKDVLTDEENKKVTEKVVYKSKILELFNI